MRSVDELIKVAYAGGGLDIDCRNIPTDDLIKLAYAVANKNSPLTLRGLDTRATDDLIRIAYAGSGRVIFVL